MLRSADDQDKCNAGCGRMTLHGTCLSCRQVDADKQRYDAVIRRPRQYKPTHPSWFNRSK